MEYVVLQVKHLETAHKADRFVRVRTGKNVDGQFYDVLEAHALVRDPDVAAVMHFDGTVENLACVTETRD